MNGTYHPTTGAVTVFGQPAHRTDSRVRGSIGYLPQLFILYPNLSVKENIDFGVVVWMGWFSRRAPPAGA
jgi:ABC-2 type transport system ATP-binding protein